MYVLLLTSVLAVAQNPQPAAQPADRAAAPDRAAVADGAWTVVAYERNGVAVPSATNMTATLRNNTITFAPMNAGTAAGGDAGGANRMPTFRVDFGPAGTVRVTETAAGGTGAGSGSSATQPGQTGLDAGSGTGTGTGRVTGSGTNNTPQGRTVTDAGTGAGDLPAGSGNNQGRAGVYVLSSDYLVIAVHDAAATSGTTATGTGTAATAATSTPQVRSYMTVVLRRADAGTGSGATQNRR